MPRFIMQPEDHSRFEQAQEAAAACERWLKERYGVRQVYLFGSLAGQSPWHSRSDIDLAVEGLPPEKYVRALSELWGLLPEGLELDLVTLEDAPAELAARISSSSINLSAMKDVAAELATQVQEVKMSADAQSQSLKEDIQGELVSLTRIAEEAKQLLHRLPGEPTFVEIRAAGSIVHDFYSGVERIFERIAVTLGHGLPVAGPGWHTVLLQSMETPAQGIRPAVIDRNLALRLVDLLRFRHLFRHSYGYELQWEKLQPLIEGLEETHQQLRGQIERFVESI